MKNYALRVPPELFEQSRALADEMDMSINAFIVHALQHFVDPGHFTGLADMTGINHVNAALEEMEDIKRRLDRLETMARSQGAAI